MVGTPEICVCLFACFLRPQTDKEFINLLDTLSLLSLLTLPAKGKEQSGASIMCTCYLL